jgi:hypothetical protein
MGTDDIKTSNNSGYINSVRHKMYGYFNSNTVETGTELGPNHLSRSTN